MMQEVSTISLTMTLERDGDESWRDTNLINLTDSRQISGALIDFCAISLNLSEPSGTNDWYREIQTTKIRTDLWESRY